MKNQSLPTVIWWRSRSVKRKTAARFFVEGFGMQELVPACHMGVVSSFEQTKIMTMLHGIFSGTTDRWFIAPICATCHERFTDLNETSTEEAPDFEWL